MVKFSYFLWEKTFLESDWIPKMSAYIDFGNMHHLTVNKTLSNSFHYKEMFFRDVLMNCAYCLIFSQRDQLDRYIPRYLVFAIVWSFSGDGKLKVREDLGLFIKNITTIPLPSSLSSPLVDFEVHVQIIVLGQINLSSILTVG